MRKIIQAVAALLTLCLLLGACAKGGGKGEDAVTVTGSLEGKETLVGNIPCSFPLVQEKTALHFLVTGYGDVKAEDVYVWQKYAEMTGVDVNWTTVKKSERDEYVSKALSNKQAFDVMMRCKINANKLMQYGASGYIIDLAKDNLLQKNAPNCWAYLSSHPDALASVLNPDGTIYALPQINAGAELRVSRKLFINKNWLAKVNMSVPTTTEEFYDLLKAFKEQDANGNGDPHDEIPLCSPDWLSIQEAFFGAFGLANRGLHNQVVDCDEATGDARLIAASDGYKAYLDYFRRLYTEGLLDQYAFTRTTEQWLNDAQNDKIGVFSSTNLASLPADKVDNWVAVEEALAGPNGDKLWTAIRANFHSTGAALIPATCENPALVLRWLDYFWTDEGTLFYHMGIENDTFVANADGTYDYAPRIYEAMKTDNKSFDDEVALYSPYPGGANPTVEIAPYFRGGEMAQVPAEAARKLFEYGPKEYWPSFTFTPAESERMNAAQTDVSKCISAQRIAFIKGSKSLDTWDSYIAELEHLGAGTILEAYNAAIDRYALLLKG